MQKETRRKLREIKSGKRAVQIMIEFLEPPDELGFTHGDFMDETYICQFCEEETPAEEWIDDICPKCGKEYDPILAQDSEE